MAEDNRIEEMQGRWTLVLDRIARGLDYWSPEEQARLMVVEEDLRAEVAQLRSDLDSRDAQVNADATELEQLRAASEELDRLRSAEAELERLRADVGDVDLVSAERDAARDEAAQLSQNLADSQAEVSRLSAALVEAGNSEAPLQELRTTLAARETDLATVQNALAEQTEEARALRAALSTSEANLDDLRSTLDQMEQGASAEPQPDRSSEVDALEAKLATLSGVLEQTQGQVTQAEETTTTTRMQLDASRAEAEELRRALEQAEARASNAQAELEQVQSAKAEQAAAAPVAPAAPSNTAAAEVARLKAGLEAERQARGELQEKLRALNGREETATAELRMQISQQRQSLSTLDSALMRLRHSANSLRDKSEALRLANAQGLGDSELINSTLISEIEALKALRKVDAAEIGALMDALSPLLMQPVEDESGSAQRPAEGAAPDGSMPEGELA